MGYYDGTKLLSLMDINGKKPELYFCTTNRTGGKTTYFNRLAVNRFLRNKEKFLLYYRYANELDSVGEKFFKDVGDLFFKGHEMSEKMRNKGTFCELFLNGESCGYAVALNYAEKVKKLSHLFSDVKLALFDEFQSETDAYVSREIEKFLSINTSIARGQGKQRRYVPHIFIGNPITTINPYYTCLGISDRLTKQTKFLRGDGWVLEQGFNESASIAQAESPLLRAFSNEKYIAYGREGVYLNDTDTLIERPEGRSTYMCTIRYNGNHYGVRAFLDSGIIYCDNNPDLTYPDRFASDTNGIDANYVLLSMNQTLLSQLRLYWQHGCFRFKNQECKKAIIKILSY